MESVGCVFTLVVTKQLIILFLSLRAKVAYSDTKQLYGQKSLPCGMSPQCQSICQRSHQEKFGNTSLNR